MGLPKLRVSSMLQIQLKLTAASNISNCINTRQLNHNPGYLWQTGYTSGAYSTPLFPDVAPTLRRWHSSNKKIAIYSSGSVFAQKLLFQHVKDDGSTKDLSYLIDHQGWFDTLNAGPKTEKGSYELIARTLEMEVAEVLFLSDNVRGGWNVKPDRGTPHTLPVLKLPTVVSLI